MTLRLSGTSDVGFTTASPWYKLPDHATGLVAVTGPLDGISGATKQAIGLLTQVLTQTKYSPPARTCIIDIGRNYNITVTTSVMH